MAKELDMNAAMDDVEPKSRRNLVALVVVEAVTLALASVATIVFDFGWIGSVVIAVLVALFTYGLFRAGENRARATGNLSPAMARYNRRMLGAGAIYTVGLFAAIWAHDSFHPNGILAFAIAFLPSIGVLLMVYAMGRLVAEEEDEYQRHRHVRASLFGLGTLLTIATVWGFFEQFDLVPHMPAWAAVPVFALGLGLANCSPWGRQ
jgi:hypothetical protein